MNYFVLQLPIHKKSTLGEITDITVFNYSKTIKIQRFKFIVIFAKVVVLSWGRKRISEAGVEQRGDNQVLVMHDGGRCSLI